MKTLTKLMLIAVFAIGGTSLLKAQDDAATKEFKVYGNCSMCESRIEKAVKSIDGVSLTDWDKETKMISVTFDAEKVELHNIHRAIAKVGHDTDTYKADDKVYKELPGCCQYDRPEAEKKAEKEAEEGHEGHKN